MNSLFIGRFQPFHLGHLSVIKNAIAESDRLFIGIGSSEANFQAANPFTCGERFQMIEAALDEAGIPREKYEIVTIRNIDNYALWVRHLELYIPPFERVYTGSETVKYLFEDHNRNSKTTHEIVNIKKELKISGTGVREMMVRDGKWEMLLPASVASLIKKWDGINRLKAVQEA